MFYLVNLVKTLEISKSTEKSKRDLLFALKLLNYTEIPIDQTDKTT